MSSGRNGGDAALRLRDVSRTYHDGAEDVRVLDGVDIDVAPGETLAVTGASGSGKSTLLHVAAGMDLPDSGTVEVLGESINRLPEPERTRYRAANIGLVFQDYNLIESLTAEENIELVCWLTDRRADRHDRHDNRHDNRHGNRHGNRHDNRHHDRHDARHDDRHDNRHDHRSAIRALAEELGIAELLGRRPDQLSGGQQQRVAIARALIHSPALVLADEPTGSLDQAHAEQVMDVFADAVSARGCALVLVTHSAEVAARCDRRLRLSGGRLVTD